MKATQYLRSCGKVVMTILTTFYLNLKEACKPLLNVSSTPFFSIIKEMGSCKTQGLLTFQPYSLFLYSSG